MFRRICLTVALAVLASGTGCGDEQEDARVPFDVLTGTLGPEGGELVGEDGTSLSGVSLSVPAGVLSEAVAVEVRLVVDETPLPDNAFSIGDQFQVGGDAALAGSATLTVPFDPEEMRRFIEDIQGVKVWRRAGEGWETADVVAVDEQRVSVAVDALSTYGPGVRVAD